MSKKEHMRVQERKGKTVSQITLVRASARKPMNKKANKKIRCL